MQRVRRTRKLRVRLFRNPAARGTCCQVLDSSGAPLYVNAATDYAEFRHAIANVPGFYRLDQCDDEGVEIEGTQPAYVSIEHLRNARPGDGAAGSGHVDPLVIIQNMAAIQADVMKTLAAQQAALMAATAEILRAPYRPAPPPSPELRNGYEEEDDNELEDDDDDAEAIPSSSDVLGLLGPLLPTIAAKFGEQLGQRVIGAILDVLGRAAPAAAPAPVSATPPPAPAMPASQAVPAATTRRDLHADAIRQGSMPTLDLDRADDAADAVLAPRDIDAGDGLQPAGTGLFVQGPAPVTTASPTLACSPCETDATATLDVPAVPTPEQLAHLIAVYERLTPPERVLTERVIERMTPETRAQWIAALATTPVDDAAIEIRAVLAELQTGQPR